ncbi:MAG TPA: FAD-binding oxidoreductase [Nevskia sp.]|nr:FAD-binding oxidoreductase [Nevskia sp.]
MSVEAQSWGRYPRARQRVLALHDRAAPLPATTEAVLPRGNGRSYGDTCLNPDGVLLATRALDRFITFDAEQGILRCESGVLLSEILALVVPHGWFLPVTPGTQHVTVGGAIANDVHGKNHHAQGSFGEHLRGFELLRSDGSRRWCSSAEHADWFRATVGGLGLTGLITWAELQLMRVAGPAMAGETLRFSSLREFFELSGASDRDHEYTVAWVDCLARGAALGRGLFMRGGHAPGAIAEPPAQSLLRMPFTPPLPLVNGLSLRAFNTLYYGMPRRSSWRAHYRPFLYPLDSIRDWNRMYGPAGFLQYQCVVPPVVAEDAVRELLERIARSGQGSFLSVLKLFGDRAAPGLLSFARPGATLALDFPNRGAATFELLEQLDQVVVQAGGAVYPAKDARMSGPSFRKYFPAWREFQAYLDPRFSSGFWRRVME